MVSRQERIGAGKMILIMRWNSSAGRVSDVVPMNAIIGSISKMGEGI